MQTGRSEAETMRIFIIAASVGILLLIYFGLQYFLRQSQTEPTSDASHLSTGDIDIVRWSEFWLDKWPSIAKETIKLPDKLEEPPSSTQRVPIHTEEGFKVWCYAGLESTVETDSSQVKVSIIGGWVQFLPLVRDSANKAAFSRETWIEVSRFPEMLSTALSGAVFTDQQTREYFDVWSKRVAIIPADSKVYSTAQVPPRFVFTSNSRGEIEGVYWVGDGSKCIPFVGKHDNTQKSLNAITEILLSIRVE